MTDLNTSAKAPNTTETAIGFIPCYRLPFLSLFHADCMEIMKQYPDKYFDLAIVDPPYGLKIANSEYLGNDKNDKRWNGRANGYRHTVKDWDNEIPNEDYFNELQRVSKNQIIWGWNYFVSYFNDCPSYLVWNKEASGNYSDCEMAWCSIKGTNKIFKWLWNGFRKQRPQPRIHPTEKPIELYSWQFQEFATEGMKILDTHFGSGSIALAVDKANRLDKMNLHLTACEIDKEYIDKAIKRISESIKQGTLSF